MDAPTRLLRLLGLLHARATWSGEELAERLGVTTRTLRRDVARLRGLDHPVESIGGPRGGYRLGRGAQLPPLVLDDQEALAMALGLRMATAGAADGLEDAAVSALVKLERVLPERLAQQLRDVQEATVTVPAGPSIPADPGRLLVLAQACRRRQRVRFVYTDAGEVRSMRLVDPLRLVHAARRWYLVAFDLDRDDWRTFRVDRLTSPVATGEPCSPRPAVDPELLVRSGLTVAAYPVQALVRLHVDHEEAAHLVPPAVGMLEPDGPATTLLRIGGASDAGLAGHLASLPCEVEVLEPDSLATALRAHVERLLGSS